MTAWPAEAINMSNRAIKASSSIGNLLITLEEGRWLIYRAEQAVSIRDFESLSRIGLRLREFPGNYFDAGLFYTALALNRTPGGQVVGNAIVQELAESHEQWIRARALFTLGLNIRERDPLGALAFYQKAAKVNSHCPLNLYCTAMMSLAARPSLDGLNSIAGLAGFVGRIYPSYKFNYLNSVAVELNANGRTDEARRVIAPVLTAPCINRYQEWAESAREIDAEANVAPSVTVPNVLAFRVNRQEQVRRIERVILDTRIDGGKLRRYADAGAAVL